MGVPAFFRWLSKKYPSIVVHCVEEKPKVGSNGEKIPVDCTKPNPNDIEFDNLYLDMNGIIHPCCHPENKPAPKNEDEMMLAIFEYIDRLFAIIRPRRLLYMAIDGVAPRAKMNQQRSRRFRASKESYEKKEQLDRIRRELEERGVELPPTKSEGEHFDSNCITPGTPFMFRLAECLRFYIHCRLQEDPAWQGIKVILSDANVPGEGEHKIMDFIRKQRAQPDHNPNTRHCLCGADADLIMLGLATHELDFTIIREEFKPNQPRPCEICAQLGHEAKECTGMAREKRGEHDEFATSDGFSDVNFIFLRLCVLREYLERDLRLDGLPFKYDFERVIDDWVFMCFFVGNDFLPHLPSLEIREGAIDRLVRIYKETIYTTGGYLADAGDVNLSRVQVILTQLGFVEDEIFKNRRETELEFRRRDEAKKRQQQQWKKPAFMMQGQYAPQPVNKAPSAVAEPRRTAAEGRVQAAQAGKNQNSTNYDAAASLRSMLYRDDEQPSSSSTSSSATSGSSVISSSTTASSKTQTSASASTSGSMSSTSSSLPPAGGAGAKRKVETEGAAAVPDEDATDDVRLWEAGWKDRYYQQKFGVDADDVEFRQGVAAAYARGLCWVLRYYYQGCASWDWYFPYHYAPFASDFHNISDLPNDFEKDTKPFRPLEQLMAVFPAASRQHVPPTWQSLMYDPDSPIIDFYPTNFRIDLNGKKFAWMGVALLPFVDERRLLKTLESYYSQLEKEEKCRNVRGSDKLFVSSRHPSYDFLMSVYEESKEQPRTEKECLELATRLCDGMLGTIWACEFAVMRGKAMPSPLPALSDLNNCRVASVNFKDPHYAADFVYLAKVLKGARPPPPAVKPEGFNKDRQGNYRPQLGFQRNSGYRDNASSAVAERMISNSLMGNYPGERGRMPPRPHVGSGGPVSVLGAPPPMLPATGYHSPRLAASDHTWPGAPGAGGAGAWQRNVQASHPYQQHISRPQPGNGFGGLMPQVPVGYHPYGSAAHGYGQASATGGGGSRRQQEQDNYYGFRQQQPHLGPTQQPGHRDMAATYYSSSSYHSSASTRAPSSRDPQQARPPPGGFPPPASYRRQ